MAELTREVLIKAEPSTIFAFLIEPGMQSWLGTDVEFDAVPVHLQGQRRGRP